MHPLSSSFLRAVGVAGLITLALGAVQPAFARPEFLAKFQSDPMRRAEVDGCGTCHVKTEGGGASNDFGTAFDAAAREITPLLRASFPQHFNVASASCPTAPRSSCPIRRARSWCSNARTRRCS